MVEEIFSDFFHFLCQNTKVNCRKCVANTFIRCKKWIFIIFYQEYFRSKRQLISVDVKKELFEQLLLG